jgi:hypothetical protein
MFRCELHKLLSQSFESIRTKSKQKRGGGSRRGERRKWSKQKRGGGESARERKMRGRKRGVSKARRRVKKKSRR